MSMQNKKVRLVTGLKNDMYRSGERIENIDGTVITAPETVPAGTIGRVDLDVSGGRAMLVSVYAGDDPDLSVCIGTVIADSDQVEVVK